MMKKHGTGGALKLASAAAAIMIALIGFSGCEQPASDTPAAANPGPSNPGTDDPGTGDDIVAVTTTSFKATMEHNLISIELTGGKFAENLEVSYFTFFNNQYNSSWGDAVVRDSDIKATITGVNVPQNWSGTTFKCTIKPEAFAEKPSSAAAAASTVAVIPVPKDLEVVKSTDTASYGKLFINATESGNYDQLGKTLQGFKIYWSESESTGYTLLAEVPTQLYEITLRYYQKDVLTPGTTYWYRVSAVYPEGESAQCAAVSYTHELDGEELTLGELKESDVQKQDWTPGYKYFHFAVEKDAEYSITFYTGSPYTANIFYSVRYGYASNTADEIENRYNPIPGTSTNPYIFTADKDGFVVLSIENQNNGSGTFGIQVEKTAGE